MNGFAKVVQGYLIDYWIRKRLKKYLVRLRDEWQVRNEPTYLKSNFSCFPHKTISAFLRKIKKWIFNFFTFISSFSCPKRERPWLFLLSKLNWCFDILKIFWRKNDICWIEKKKVWRNKNQSVRIRKHVFEQKQKMQKHLLSNNPDFHLKSALFKRCFSKVGWVFQYFFWNIFFWSVECSLWCDRCDMSAPYYPYTTSAPLQRKLKAELKFFWHHFRILVLLDCLALWKVSHIIHLKVFS